MGCEVGRGLRVWEDGGEEHRPRGVKMWDVRWAGARGGRWGGVRWAEAV